MILSVSLNPAVDRTLFVERLDGSAILSVQSSTRDAAGKGVNVARTVHKLGGEVRCLGFLGGTSGSYIRDVLDSEGIDHAFTPIEQPTRENVKVVADDGQHIEYNEIGPHISDAELGAFKDAFYAQVKANDLVILSGSIPPGVPIGIYGELIDYCNRIKVATILDAAGDLFADALRHGPTIVKPNRHELEQYAHRELSTIREFASVAKKMQSYGIRDILVSLGSEGSILVRGDTTYRVAGLALDVKSAVGAGDAMVAGYAVAFRQFDAITDRLRYASAVAAASCLTEGTRPGDPDQVQAFLKDIKIAA